MKGVERGGGRKSAGKSTECIQCTMQIFIKTIYTLPNYIKWYVANPLEFSSVPSFFQGFDLYKLGDYKAKTKNL